MIHPLAALCSTPHVWFWLAFAALFGDRSFVTLGPVFARARADLHERRLRIRQVLLPWVSGWLGGVVLMQLLIVLALNRATPAPLVLLNLAVLDVLSAGALLLFVRVHPGEWIEIRTAPAPRALGRAESAVLERLNQRLVAERLYAREALTIGALAALLGTQEHILRRVIHHGLRFRNFNDFLHEHRLREIARRLRDPSQARLPVLTIALEAGYGSVGPFNRAFKQRFRVTPTVYRRGSEPELPRRHADASLASEAVMARASDGSQASARIHVPCANVGARQE